MTESDLPAPGASAADGQGELPRSGGREVRSVTGGEGDQGFAPEAVSWRRVALGFVVIAVLHALLAFGLFAVAFTHQPIVKIVFGVLPYLVGGLLLGILGRKEERSLLDPFYASVLPALFFPFAIELMRVYSTDPPQVAQAMARVQWLSVLAPVMVYVLVALLSCWVGERLPSRDDRRR